MIRRVYRIGVITLDGNHLALRNRTYQTSVDLDDEHAEKWRQKLLAYGRPQRAKGTSARLTGLFKTKRPNLFIGSIEDLKPLIEKIKEATNQKRGLTFFLWKNDPGKGPALSLSVDVEQPREARAQQQPRRPIEADPFDVPGDDDPFGNG